MTMPAIFRNGLWKQKCMYFLLICIVGWELFSHRGDMVTTPGTSVTCNPVQITVNNLPVLPKPNRSAKHKTFPLTTPTATRLPSSLRTTPRPCNYSALQKYIDNKTFLCINPTGGLGNFLFLYASAYGVASRLNRTLLLGKDIHFENFFNISSQHVDQLNCLQSKYITANTRFDCKVEPQLLKLPKGKNFCVGRYLQSYKYFDHVKEDIRKQYTFRKEFKDTAKKIIDESIKVYRQRTNRTGESVKPVLVGVHVRRGNFVNHGYGYNVATPQYMDNATRYFRNKYGRVLFLVCSNDMRWTKKHVTGDDVIYIEGNDYAVDMSLLVSCDHTLSTVGSFSWWSAFLTGGDTVYYQWPAKEGSKLRAHFNSNYSEYFPPSWIGMT